MDFIFKKIVIGTEDCLYINVYTPSVSNIVAGNFLYGWSISAIRSRFSGSRDSDDECRGRVLNHLPTHVLPIFSLRAKWTSPNQLWCLFTVEDFVSDPDQEKRILPII